MISSKKKKTTDSKQAEKKKKVTKKKIKCYKQLKERQIFQMQLTEGQMNKPCQKWVPDS